MLQVPPSRSKPRATRGRKNLNFESMIGGPLNAVIRAQAQSAQTSVDFIKSVGFDASKDPDKADKPTMVSFTYEKPITEDNDDGTTTTKQVPHKLSVPILTMLPIPFIRIEETKIDFNAKINSIQESQTTNSKDLKAALGVKGGWGPVSANLKVSYAHKKSNSSSSKTERTYSMAVHVRAVQDELPAGTERLLSILESNIQETKIETPAS